MKLNLFNNKVFRAVAGMFDGSVWSAFRRKDHVPFPTDSKDELNQFTRTELVRYSRYLSTNLGIVSGAISTLRTYSLRSGFSAVPLGGSPDQKRSMREAFDLWAKRPTADRMTNLHEAAGIICETIDRDGEIFVVFSELNGEPIFQLVETHHFTHEGDGFESGVRYDENGAAVEYRLNNGTLIPAAAVLHLRDPHRGCQRRGYPALSFAINNLFDAKDMLGLAKHGFKTQLSAAVIAKRMKPTSSPMFGTPVNSRTTGAATSAAIEAANEKRFESVTGATVLDFAVGEDAVMNRPEFPGQHFQPFVESFYRDFSVGIDLPFAFIWCQDVGGTTQRFIIERAKGTFERRQSILEQFYSRAWVHFQASQPGIASVPNWWKVDWRKGRTITVDLGRDANQDQLEIANGRQSFGEFYASHGQDWRAEWQEQAEILGMTFEEFQAAMRRKIFGTE